MTSPLLSVRSLETYYGPVMALRGVSLDVREGQIVTLLGANGAGKTTLLKSISGVIDPAKGAIALAGEPIHGLEPNRIVNRGVVHVPEGREMFPLLTVEENLAMGAFTTPPDRAAEEREKVFGYFPVLRERLAQRAGTLSGGQQQMLAIARGLMARPRVMLLDEPSLGLSPRLVTEIFSILRRMNDEQGVTLLLVEQNARVALELADFGYVMETGRIVMEGPGDRLQESRDIREFYLGMREQGVRDQQRWKRRKTWR